MHVQLGPIKLKKNDEYSFKSKWQEIWNGLPTRHEHESGDVGNELSEIE
jgi:hypothetical protein